MSAEPPPVEPQEDAPEQLPLPPELLAAMLLPAPIPSERRRGRPVRSVPDIANYQPKENR
ncbi:hypothetical protein ACWGLG_16150 [Streptomyces antimycoticus]